MLSSTFFTDQYIKQLSELQISVKKKFLGLKQGNHVSVKKGHGIEFSQYRPYELGDNPRQIDWNVYARSDKLYIKQYQEEEDILVTCLIDNSASMHLDQKIDFAINISASVAYVALNQKDSICASVLGVKSSAIYKNLKSIHAYYDFLYNCTRRPQETSFYKQIKESISPLKYPGVIFLISDFLMPWQEIQKALTAISSKNYYFLAVQLCSLSDLYPLNVGESYQVQDAETEKLITLDWSHSDQQLYTQKILEHSTKLKNICQSLGGRLFVYYEDKKPKYDFILEDVLQSGAII